MNLLKPLILVSLASFISKILGFVRDIIVARIFGAGIMTDSFFTAFKLINLLRRIFAEGVFFQVFIPILISHKKKYKLDVTKRFISSILGALILTLTIVIIASMIFAPYILKIVVPGFINTGYKFILTIKILRIILPFILIISLSTIFGAILNSWNIFFIPTFSSSLLNISMIFFALFSSFLSNTPIFSLAWSVVIGSILQLMYQMYYTYKINMLTMPKIDINNKGMINMFKKMWPALISILIHQISTVGNTMFTSFLSSGSISWMYYADRIMEFPSGILGAALNTILFPYLSRSVSNKNNSEYSRSLDWGLRLCFLLSVPMSFALIILSKPIIFSMFQYGKFSYFDAVMTQHALIAYSIGLVGIIMVRILTPSFYSHQDTKTPLKVSLITFFATQLLNFLLIFILKHVGLSLSISITSCLNSLLLYFFLIKKRLFKPQPGWKKFIIKIFLSVFIMSLVLILTLKVMPDWQTGNMRSRMLRLIFILFLGLISYLFSLVIMGFKVKDFNNSIISNK